MVDRLALGLEGDGVLISLGDFRAPGFGLRVGRSDVGFGGELELFMQLSGTCFGLFTLNRL
jgi:hypothetical protein